MHRPTSLLLFIALAGCAAREPARPAATCASAPTTSAPPAAAHRYDAAGLERVLEVTRTATDPAALRERARAAHDRAELLRFEETRASESKDDAAAARAQRARVETAGAGLLALDGAGEPDAELLFLRGELEAYLITDWRSGLLHGGPSREALRAALARDPAHPGARLAWARQYHYLPPLAGGDQAECARLLQELVRDAPAYEPAWSFLGQVLRGMGRTDEARQALLRARELDPTSPRAAWYLPQVGP